ncbi:MAG: ARC6/PARC6 family protein [Candidatus Obscuribacterales bacterium]|nr:ARC6/PARC6 family protein [Candidatus Obscuribacterales bacterium]
MREPSPFVALLKSSLLAISCGLLTITVPAYALDADGENRSSSSGSESSLGSLGSEGSLDSMWSDESGKESGKENSKENSKGTSKESKNSSQKSEVAPRAIESDFSSGEEVKTSSSNKGESKKQDLPLCTIDSFKMSELVKTSCWPGVGPFQSQKQGQSQNEISLSDPQENKLHFQAEGDKLARAELLLVGHRNDGLGMLNLQMVSAYLLEAIGAKNKRIADFNDFLEKHKHSLAHGSKDAGSISTTSGPYDIVLKSAVSEGNPAFLIQVKKHHSDSHSLIALASSPQQGSLRPDENGDIERRLPAAGSSVPQKVVSRSTTSQPDKTQPDKTQTDKAQAGKPKTQNTGNPSANQTGSQSSSSSSSPSSTTVKQPKPTDDLKEKLQETLRAWQTHKKQALRERNIEGLEKYLSGRALARQKDGIKWLTTNKKYYEMTPRGVTVDKYQILSQNPLKYTVTARVKELSKLVDEATGKANESEDSYNVNYTMEKSGDGSWIISDSQLIASNKQNR